MQRLIKTPNTIEQSEIDKAKRLLDTNPVMLYHGNQDAAMIPVFGQGKSNNDYGQGFYTTPDKELGKEWAYSGFTKGECGYLHSYCLDKTGLEILDLTKLDSMHWLILGHCIAMMIKEIMQSLNYTGLGRCMLTFTV